MAQPGELSNKELYPDVEDPHTLTQGDAHTAFGDKSPGVRRIEAISACFTRWHLVVLFITILLISYAYGLDGTIRYLFQNTAFNEFGQSAQISTVTVVRSIVAAAAQPAFAKVRRMRLGPGQVELMLDFRLLWPYDYPAAGHCILRCR